MKQTFSASVTKDSLVFSAAHFITFNGDICERLHGHNWRVNVEISGELDENSYVYDFIALRDATMNLVHALDHRVLLPQHHPEIKVTVVTNEVSAKFRERRWIFPLEDCVILPISNTTAELIAKWISDQLIKDLPGIQQAMPRLIELKVQVEENFGQWATCRTSL
jgi:6-pyruvoyltetrahydropterin/6-carboxytetrahydropterin synthase